VEVKRLDKSLWHLYPIFEQRCRQFALQYDLKCPVEVVLGEMLQRWIASPAIAGYFVALEGEEMKGHLASWVLNAYGQNRLFVYQAAIEETDFTSKHHTGLLLREWLDGLNAEAPPEAQVHFGEFVTWHAPETWARYLKGIGVKSTKIRSVIQMEF
jgi:hypothetical protein